MERPILYVILLFIVTVIAVFNTNISPAAYAPIHNSSIRVEVDSMKLNNALALLDKHPEYKRYVEVRIKVIRKGSLTRIMYPDQTPTIEITDTFINSQTVPWLASVLVHEARHVEQRVEGKMGTVTDQQIELDANKIQATALFFMGGQRSNVTLLLAHNGMHFDTNNNGRLDDGDNWGY